MLLIATAEPTPLVQTAIYMAGVLVGYTLLVRPEEWQRAWDTIRDTWARRPED